ncbi:hypothetical protein ID866_11286 [Astraeus odoratus]|nr:hypothetical protein ID866_11286 [Astraeus odoratus]
MTPLRGGFPVVYRGTLRQRVTENKVAIKIYLTSQRDDDMLKRIVRQIDLWSKLRHENVHHILGISTDFDCTISIISNWMAMGNAHLYVQNKENDPRPLLMDIASGLQYLHTHELGPIIHSDIKGSNVLISDDHRALLSGFHCSTLAGNSAFNTGVDPPRGGIRWMAPEILEDFDPSSATDVWAFGMTVLELFTRSIPLPDIRHDALAILEIITGKLPVRPTQEATHFRMTSEWWAVCLSCWKRDPSSRPMMSEVHRRIKSIMVRSARSQRLFLSAHQYYSVQLLLKCFVGRQPITV